MANGWNPEDYVRKTMDVGGRTRCLLPRDLAQKRFVDAYAARMAEARAAAGDRTAADEYRRCVELLIQGEMDGGDEKPLLLSPNTAFPAWFRVCYPESIDIGIVNAWGDAAKRELSASPGLMKLVRDLDPGKWERIKRALWFYNDPEKGGAL